ncbi:endonuclease, partial [Escherichia coli]|nr:endonuclease [Escherichia coli]
EGFSVLITDEIPDLHLIGDAQCFPLYLYCDGNSGESKKYAISDFGLDYFNDFYATDIISKEDIFYYVYGLLSSRDYLSRYADNLAKE